MNIVGYDSIHRIYKNKIKITSSTFSFFLRVCYRKTNWVTSDYPVTPDKHSHIICERDFFAFALITQHISVENQSQAGYHLS